MRVVPATESTGVEAAVVVRMMAVVRRGPVVVAGIRVIVPLWSVVVSIVVALSAVVVAAMMILMETADDNTTDDSGSDGGADPVAVMIAVGLGG